MTYVRFSTFVVLLGAVLLAPVFAGGATEEADAGVAAEPTGAEPTGSEAPAERKVVPAYDDAIAALRSLGIQVFPDEIQAQDFTLATLTGDEASLSSYRGKLVFLNFWATWCGPCIEEMPSMQVLYDELSDEGFEIVAVNLQEAPATVQEFVDEFGYTYPVLLDRRGEVGRNYSVRGIPSTYIVAPDGRLLGMKIGFRLWDEPDVIAAFRTVIETL